MHYAACHAVVIAIQDALLFHSAIFVSSFGRGGVEGAT